MKNKIQLILSFLLLVIGGHLAIMFGVLKTQNTTLFVGTHIYLTLFLLLSLIVIPIVKKNDSTKIGLAFLALTVFKMLTGIILVYFFMKSMNVSKIYILSNFFGAFFIYLIAEVGIALNELNKK